MFPPSGQPMFPPAGQPLRAWFPALISKAWLSGQHREGAGPGWKVLCQGTQRQTLGLFPGRCCPLLVKSLQVSLCWDILPKSLTILGERASDTPPSSCSSQTEAQRGDRDGLRSHSVLRAEAGLESLGALSPCKYQGRGLSATVSHFFQGSGLSATVSHFS